jgi:hypothetical protein
MPTSMYSSLSFAPHLGAMYGVHCFVQIDIDKSPLSHSTSVITWFSYSQISRRRRTIPASSPAGKIVVYLTYVVLHISKVASHSREVCNTARYRIF